MSGVEAKVTEASGLTTGQEVHEPGESPPTRDEEPKVEERKRPGRPPKVRKAAAGEVPKDNGETRPPQTSSMHSRVQSRRVRQTIESNRESLQ